MRIVEQLVTIKSSAENLPLAIFFDRILFSSPDTWRERES
jgi:hypothetical protein